MRIEKNRLIYLICSFLIVFFLLSKPCYGAPENDLVDDVWSDTSNKIGDHANYIDIKQVVLQGSTIEITVAGTLTGISSTAHFLVLLNDHGKSTAFDAAIMLSLSKIGVEYVLWTLGDPLIDTLEWTFDPTGRHSSVDNTVLRIHFLEYNKIINSNPVVASLTTEGASQYIDWAPNTYDVSFFYSIFPKLVQKLPAIPASLSPPLSTTTTTTPATTTPVTTTTPEEITTTSMETSSTPTRQGEPGLPEFALPTLVVAGGAIAGTAAIGFSLRMLRRRG